MQQPSPDHVLLVVEGVVVFPVRAMPQVATIRQLEATIKQTAERYPGAVGLLHVVGEQSEAIPDEARRQEALSMLGRLRPRLGGAAVVVRAQGFGGAAVRGVVTGIFLATRPPFPTRVFTQIPEAVSWLSESIKRPPGKAVDPQALAAAVARGLSLIGSPP